MHTGSFDQSPNLNDVMCGWAESNITRQPLGSEEEEDKLRNSLAEAMVEASPTGDSGPTSARLDGKFVHVCVCVCFGACMHLFKSYL